MLQAILFRFSLFYFIDLNLTCFCYFVVVLRVKKAMVNIYTMNKVVFFLFFFLRSILAVATETDTSVMQWLFFSPSPPLVLTSFILLCRCFHVAGLLSSQLVPPVVTGRVSERGASSGVRRKAEEGSPLVRLSSCRRPRHCARAAGCSSSSDKRAPATKSSAS